MQCHSSKEPWNRVFARMCLAGMPRGGGDGDAIRMGVLNIMRANGIREGHRPVSTPCPHCPRCPALLKESLASIWCL